MNIESSSKIAQEIHSNSGWVIAVGVALMLLGLLAIGSPLVSGIAIAWMVGFLMVMSGATRIVFALRAHQWGLGLLAGVIGALGIVAGLITLAHPLLGLSFLTLLLSAYLVIEGSTEILLAFHMRPLAGWGWTLASGISAIVLGGMIWAQWPVSDTWAIGLLLGIKMMFAGSSLMGLGFAARSATMMASD
jgi:uncharacterized membrane protein HdeD (DUF308 family)